MTWCPSSKPSGSSSQGSAAGTINTIVGSGTLITFPTLLLLRLSRRSPPTSPTTSASCAGGVTGAIGYRHELVGRRDPRCGGWPRCPWLGGVIGAVLLLVLPAAAFRPSCPVLIAVGLRARRARSPRSARAAERRDGREVHPAARRATSAALHGGVFVAGIYGGYFGAAQGVILMGILSALSSEPIQRLNGYKNVLATIVNAVAAVVFMVVAREPIDWLVVAAHRRRVARSAA